MQPDTTLVSADPNDKIPADNDKIPADTAHDVLIVIPTVGRPSVLLPTVARICDAYSGDRAIRTALVLAFNGPSAEEMNESERTARELCASAGLDLEVWRTETPIGFGAANNRGTVAAIRRWGGLPELTIYHNDDAHVAAGWTRRLLDALHTSVVCGYSEPWDYEDPSSRPRHPVEKFGRVGLVGPISNLVAGIQQVTEIPIPGEPGKVGRFGGNPDSYARLAASYYAGQRVTADFLSGFCVGISRRAMADLLLQIGRSGHLFPVQSEDLDQLTPDSFLDRASDDPSGSTDSLLLGSGSALKLVGPWDEENYPIAGYEDNDLCVRAEHSGWRCVVAADCFVAHIGHQTFDRLFPDAQRGMRNRQRYYRRWASLADRSQLVAAYRLAFEVGHDLHLMRKSFERVAQLCDGAAIVLTNNPLSVRDDIRWPREEAALVDDDRAFLMACSGADVEGVEKALHAWLCSVARNTPACRWADGDIEAKIRVEVWRGSFNERDERNRSHILAEELGADWIFSIDHDEVIENRIRREHLDQHMKHPDPLVRSYNIGWLNHWESQNVQREDPPWGDGGSYTGGMNGFRMWRVPRQINGSLNPLAPRRIMYGTANGLHCGNSPEHDGTAKRVAAIRMRHFGYTRLSDRIRKHMRYSEQDPTPLASLTGTDGRDKYSHLIHSEGMRLSAYVATNGIAAHLLLYRGESADNLARLLDWLRPIVDRVVVTWTDPWTELDQWWLADPDPQQLAAAAARMEQRAARIQWMNEHPEQPVPPPIHPIRVARRSAFARIVGTAPATGPTAEQIEVGAYFGVEWVHQPLNDDLAAARNAGLEALQADPRGIGWSLFFDLDELPGDPYRAAVCLRRMAECSDAHGWLFVFMNYHENSDPSRSEAIRMVRMLPQMRLAGRVHETYDHIFEQMKEHHDLVFRQTPFMMHHYGLSGDAAKLDAKLDRYERLCRLELTDNPHNSAAWVSLGLHYLNNGHDEQGRECLERGVLCAGSGHLAYRELAIYHARRAKVYLNEAMERTGPQSEWHRFNRPLAEMLRKQIPDLPLLGSGKGRGKTPLGLPAFALPSDVGGLASAGALSEPLSLPAAPAVPSAPVPSARQPSKARLSPLPRYRKPEPSPEPTGAVLSTPEGATGDVASVPQGAQSASES